MKREDLVFFVQDILANYDSSIQSNEGTYAWETLVEPLLARFGDDPLQPSAEDFVRDTLASEYPEMDVGELDPLADIVGIPMQILTEPIRRELRQTQLATSMKNYEYLTEDEIEGLVSVFQIPRDNGAYATVKVTVYFSTPRLVELGFTAVGYTANGLEFQMLDHQKYLPTQVAENKEGNYYFVEATMIASGPGKEYNVPKGSIVGVANVDGAVYAANKSAGGGGADRESVTEYLDRIKTEISEHAPVTDAGIKAMVRDNLGSYEVATVGHGDPDMYRDEATWLLTNEALLVPIATGEGTFNVVQDTLSGGLFDVPWPSTVELGASYLFETPMPTHILVQGSFQEIISSHVSGNIYSEVTITGYTVWVQANGRVDPSLGIDVPGGTPIREMTAVLIPLGGLQPELPLKIWTEPTIFTPMPTDNVWDVIAVESDSSWVYLHIQNPPVILRRGYDDASGVPKVPLHFSAVGAYFYDVTFTGIGSWSGMPEVALSDSPRIQVRHWDGAAFLNHLFKVTAVDFGTGIMRVELKSPVITPPNSTPFNPLTDIDISIAGENWTLYYLPDGEPVLTTDLTFPAVVLQMSGDSTPLWSADPQQWSLARPLVAEDMLGSLLLPDGTTINTDGDIGIGGCTDIFIHSDLTEDQVELDDIPDDNPISAGITCSWVSGQSSVVLNTAARTVRPGDSLVISSGEAGAYIIHGVFIDNGLSLSVNHTFTTTGIGVACEVHRNHRLNLAKTTNVLHAADDLITGLITTVAAANAIPGTIAAGQTLEILTGGSQGTYTLETVVGQVMTVDEATSSIGADISYEIYTTYPSMSFPLAELKSLDLLSGGQETGVSLKYGPPVSIKCKQGSVTDGPDTKIPISTGEEGTVVPSITDPLYSASIVRDGGGNLAEFEVGQGDVLYLDGSLNKGFFYVVSLTASNPAAPNDLDTINYKSLLEPMNAYAEVDVSFAVFAPHVTDARVYFEQPIYGDLGAVSDFLLDNDVRVLEVTTFVSGSKIYMVHPDNEDEIDWTLSDTVQGVGSLMGSSLFTELFLKRGDLIYVHSFPLVAEDVPANTFDAAGQTITLTVSGTQQTIIFKGSNPLPFDSTAGDGGFKQQMEDAFDCVVTAVSSGPGVSDVTIFSKLPVTLTSGSVLDLLGMASGTSNAATYLGDDYSGEYEVDLTNFAGTVSVNKVGSTLTFPGVGLTCVVSIYRVGRVIFEPNDLSTEYGFYYKDVEIRCLQGGTGYEVEQGDALDIGGNYFTSGFSFDAQPGFTYGDSEETYLYVPSRILDPGEEVISCSNYGMRYSYSRNQLVVTLQSLVDNYYVRATADDTMVKVKPFYRVGIGPITTSPIRTSTEIAKRFQASLDAALIDSRTVSLEDALSWLAPYGVSPGTDCKLIGYYQDMDSTRNLELGNSLTIKQAWNASVESDLIIIA